MKRMLALLLTLTLALGLLAGCGTTVVVAVPPPPPAAREARQKSRRAEAGLHSIISQIVYLRITASAPPPIIAHAI